MRSFRSTVMSLIPVVAIILLPAAQVSAEQLLVDFATYKPAPVGNWNSIAFTDANTTINNLIDASTGLATTADLTTSGVNAFADANDNWTAGDKDWVQTVAALDGFASTAQLTVQVDQLVGALYDVEVVSSSRTAAGNYISDIRVEGSFADTNYNGTAGVLGDNFSAVFDGNGPGNWLIWKDVAPVGGGLTITLDTVQGVAITNALRITQVPEPASLALIGLGGLGLLRRRKRS